MSGRPYSLATPLGRMLHARHLRVLDLCEATGIDKWAINDYLHARTVPTPARLAAICTALQCDPSEILEGAYS